MGLIKKMKALYYINQGEFNIIGNRAEIKKNNFVRFLVQMRKRKFASEIY